MIRLASGFLAALLFAGVTSADDKGQGHTVNLNLAVQRSYNGVEPANRFVAGLDIITSSGYSDGIYRGFVEHEKGSTDFVVEWMAHKYIFVSGRTKFGLYAWQEFSSQDELGLDLRSRSTSGLSLKVGNVIATGGLSFQVDDYFRSTTKDIYASAGLRGHLWWLSFVATVDKALKGTPEQDDSRFESMVAITVPISRRFHFHLSGRYDHYFGELGLRQSDHIFKGSAALGITLFSTRDKPETAAPREVKH